MPDKYTKSKIKNDQDAKRILNRALFAIHNNDKDISKRGAGLYIQGYNNPKNVLGLSGRPEIHTIDSLYQTDSIGNAQKILQYMHDKKLGAPNTSIIHPEYLLDEGVTSRMREFYNVGKNLGLNENAISALMALSYGETLYNNDLNNLFSYKKTQMPTIEGDDRIINYGLFSLENLRQTTPKEKKATGKNYIEDPNMPYGKYKIYLKENKLKDSIESQINYYINQYLPSKEKSFKIENLNNKDINSAVEYLFKMQGTKFDPKQTTTMKKRAEFFKNSKFENGGKMSIHIKPENRGKFNATKKRTGKTTEELTHSKNPLTRKRAVFALNSKKWKHANGGELLGLDYYTNQLDGGGLLNSPMVSRSIINPNLTAQSPEPVMTLTQQKVNPIIPKQGINLSGIDPLSTVSDVATLFSSPDITSQGENQQANVDEENNFDPTYIDVSQVKKDFNTKQAIGSSVGAGAGLGATVGSIVPGIGTVVGGAVGAVGGAIAGGIKSIFGKKKAKRKEKRAKNKARGLNTMATLESYMGKAYGFADGGNINNLMGRKYFAEGGLTSFNTGGSHEESPIGGIPQGIGDNGNVNLVEEGETRYQDYIFSDRLTLDEDIVKELNLPSNLIGKTFAEASEILAKDIEEHPNDPISKRGFEEMMIRLQAANNMKKDLEDSNTFAEGGSLNGEPMEPSPSIKEVEGESENLGNELKEVTDEQVKRIAASNIKEEKLKGGRASKEVRENATELFDPLEISVGIKVEMEHTDSIEAAREIALDHLTENKDYYTRLYHIGLIDEPITEEEENFLKEKWTRIEDVEALDEEQSIVDMPEEENVSSELEQPLNQEIPIEPQQFAKGGDLFGPNRNGAYFRNGRWYLNSDPRLSNKTNIRMDNPNRGNSWKTDPIYPIPPERQLFKVPDIKGGWNGILPDNTKPYGDTFNPPFIKGGEDEKTTVEPIKTNTSTTKKTSIPSIDTEEEFDRMMDRKYNFGDLTGLTGPRFDPYQLEADLEGNRIANENETSFNPISDFELTPEQLSTLSPEDYQAYKRHERAMKLQGLGSLLQYAPVLGNLIGAATVGKAERVNPTYITPEQLNDYLQYNPIDPNTYTNPILNQASNARRSFTDASGGSRAAILAANLGLNAQIQKAISDATLQAEAVNEQRRIQAKEFNRGTNQFNASERARAKQYNASAKTMTDDINARNRAARRTAIRNYLSGAMQGLGSIGREKAYRNTIKTMGMDYYLDALGQVKYKKS